VLDPRLVALLQEQFQPITTGVQEERLATSQQYEIIVSKLEGHNADRKAFQAIKDDLSTSNQTSQSQFEMLLSKFHDQELSQSAAINIIKRHITKAITDLKTESAKQPISNSPFGSKKVSRQKMNRLKRPLQTLWAASDNDQIDAGSLEEL